MIRRIGITLAAIASILAIGTSANASNYNQTGPWHIQETSGPYDVGSSNLNAGTPVTQRNPGNARDMTFSFTGFNYNGDAALLVQFSNGNFMAANTSNCEETTIKSDSGSNGTVWAMHFANGKAYLVNRYCDQNVGQSDSNVRLGGDGTQNDQWDVCNGDAQTCPSGELLALTFNAA